MDMNSHDMYANKEVGQYVLVTVFLMLLAHLSVFLNSKEIGHLNQCHIWLELHVLQQLALNTCKESATCSRSRGCWELKRLLLHRYTSNGKTDREESHIRSRVKPEHC